MSEIKVDTLTGKTSASDITVTVGASATQSLEQGLAKVRGSKNSTGTAITGTLNVSSLDDDGTGDFGINFVNAFSSATYQGLLSIPSGVLAGNSDGHFAEINSKAAGSCETQTWYGDPSTAATFIDWPYDIIIHGSLA
jgi:hypothetical protein